MASKSLLPRHSRLRRLLIIRKTHDDSPLALLLSSLLLSGAHAYTLEGRVVAVLDGDTVTVLDQAKVQHRIRLA
jgi:endonuclease YncB( thermonuclease family)